MSAIVDWRELRGEEKEQALLSTGLAIHHAAKGVEGRCMLYTAHGVRRSYLFCAFADGSSQLYRFDGGTKEERQELTQRIREELRTAAAK